MTELEKQTMYWKSKDPRYDSELREKLQKEEDIEEEEYRRGQREAADDPRNFFTDEEIAEMEPLEDKPE